MYANKRRKTVPHIRGLRTRAISAFRFGNWTDVRKLLNAKLSKKSVEFLQLSNIQNEQNIIEESCYLGYTELISIFLENNFPVDTKIYYGNAYWTMLHFANFAGHLKVVKLLVEKGASFNHENNNFSKPIHIASLRGHLDVVKYFLDIGCGVNCRDHNFMTPLSYAVSADNHSMEIIKLLVKRGADIKYGNSMLVAAKKNKVDVMEYFLSSGVDVNEGDDIMALHCAVSSGSIEAVQFLLDHGANVNSWSRLGTPLCISLLNCNSRITTMLLSKGAHVNILWEGTYILHFVVCGDLNFCAEIIGFLCERNVDVHDTDDDNQTALQVLVFTRFAIDYLDDNFADSKVIDIVKTLINYGAIAYVVDCNSNTLLHWAAFHGSVSLVKYLIEYGLNVNALNDDGKKAIDIANLKGHTEVVEIIFEYHSNKFLI